MSTYAASTSWARAAESTSRPGRSFTWRPALARSLQQASRVLQQRTKEEADVEVILERVDVAKGCVVDAGGRTSVVHQFAHVDATLPHVHEPRFCERPQIIALRAQPDIDRGVVSDRRRETKDVIHRASSIAPSVSSWHIELP
jgi:hypothetical protein